MAVLAEYKNAWLGPHTQDQKDLLAGFRNGVLQCAKMAAGHLGSADFDSAGKFGLKMEERFFQDTGKIHRFYRASVGSSIERTVYDYILKAYGALELGKVADAYGAVWKGEGYIQQKVVPVIFALEFTGSCPGFPCSFKNSRPDIRLSLGKGTDGVEYEALLDLTSEKQKGHVLKKRDKWIAKANVPYIAEVIWTDDDIMHK
jgi:hypothetical protein